LQIVALWSKFYKVKETLQEEKTMGCGRPHGKKMAETKKEAPKPKKGK
jgi:hypothetical protein